MPCSRRVAVQPASLLQLNRDLVVAGCRDQRGDFAPPEQLRAFVPLTSRQQFLRDCFRAVVSRLFILLTWLVVVVAVVAVVVVVVVVLVFQVEERVLEKEPKYLPSLAPQCGESWEDSKHDVTCLVRFRGLVVVAVVDDEAVSVVSVVSAG